MVHARNSRPRYVPDTSKALEVILWLANRHPNIDLYHLVKAAFFADKMHIAKYGRPIVGDVYEAQTYGPLPRVIYGLLRHEPLEIMAAGLNGDLPFEVTDTFAVRATHEPNPRRLSESDQEALEHGLEVVRGKSFQELYEMTHDDPAFINAEDGVMDYRDFIPESDPEREAKAQDLCEVARYAVF